MSKRRKETLAIADRCLQRSDGTFLDLVYATVFIQSVRLQRLGFGFGLWRERVLRQIRETRSGHPWPSCTPNAPTSASAYNRRAFEAARGRFWSGRFVGGEVTGHGLKSSFDSCSIIVATEIKHTHITRVSRRTRSLSFISARVYCSHIHMTDDDMKYFHPFSSHRRRYRHDKRWRI